MRYYVKGFSWEPRFPLAAERLPSRAEAIAALEKMPTAHPHAGEAHAAFSVKDYGHAVECAGRS